MTCIRKCSVRLNKQVRGALRHRSAAEGHESPLLTHSLQLPYLRTIPSIKALCRQPGQGKDTWPSAVCLVPACLPVSGLPLSAASAE